MDIEKRICDYYKPLKRVVPSPPYPLVISLVLRTVFACSRSSGRGSRSKNRSSGACELRKEERRKTEIETKNKKQPAGRRDVEKETETSNDRLEVTTTRDRYLGIDMEKTSLPMLSEVAARPQN